MTPTIKTKRKELIIHVQEWKETLERAKQEYGRWLASWLAFDCIFGKRRNEICTLLRKNVWVQNRYLYVKFFVGKKKSKRAFIDRMPYTKKKTLRHYAVPYILEYLEEYDSTISSAPEGYLYPSSRKATTVTVTTKFKTREDTEETRSYTYPVKGGFRSPQNVHYYIKKVNPNIWAHLGRHTVATEAADRGATEYEIAHILDVTPKTASKYVHHGTRLTESWSRRKE